MRELARILLPVAVAAMMLGGGLFGPGATAIAHAGHPNDDPPPVAVSPKAALRFAEKVSAAGQNAADTGNLRLTVTQKEVTSFLNIWTLVSGQLGGVKDLQNIEGLQQLTGGAESAELDALLNLMQQGDGVSALDTSNLSLRLSIKEPEVRFTGDGRIDVRGHVALLFWKWPVRIVVSPRASRGEMELDFVEGSLGPIAMPEAAFDLVGKGLAGALLAGQDYAEITEIKASQGKLTIRGRYNK